MLTVRLVLLAALIAVYGGAALVMPLPQRPYAPALFDRHSLDVDDGVFEKRQPVAATPTAPLVRKRNAGQSCKRSDDQCDGTHLFCSTVDRRCKHKRGLSQACRTSDGCAAGLACVNFVCQSAPTKTVGVDPLAELQSRLFAATAAGTEEEKRSALEQRAPLLPGWLHWPAPSGSPWDRRELEQRSSLPAWLHWPSPSGSPWDRRELEERTPLLPSWIHWPSPSGSPWDRRELSQRSPLLPGWIHWPSPSGSPWDKRTLIYAADNDGQQAAT